MFSFLVPFDKLQDQRPQTTSKQMRERVIRARAIQAERFVGQENQTNAHMQTPDLRKFAPLDRSCIRLIEAAVNGFGLSARAYDKIVRIARTIADLEASDCIESAHIAEAIRYRRN